MARKRHLHQAQGGDFGFCFSADVRLRLDKKLLSVLNLFNICGLYFSADIPFTFRLNSDDKRINIPFPLTPIMIFHDWSVPLQGEPIVNFLWRIPQTCVKV